MALVKSDRNLFYPSSVETRHNDDLEEASKTNSTLNFLNAAAAVAHSFIHKVERDERKPKPLLSASAIAASTLPLLLQLTREERRRRTIGRGEEDDAAAKKG